MTARIRVLVVDDSPTVRGHLADVLRRDPQFDVIGEAGDGHAAIQLCMTLRPDVMTLDLALPGVNGLGVTEHVMAHAPTPILIVSASMNRGDLLDTYAALAAGAVDVLDKARASEPDWEARFIAAVRMAARIKVITHPRARLAGLTQSRPRTGEIPSALAPRGRRVDVVAVAASTGGPSALVEVLSALPAAPTVPVLVLLHIDAAFATPFADWLGSACGRPVAVARNGDPLDAGRILFAPPDHHLTIATGRVRLVAGPPRHHCRPSADTMFESVAAAFGEAALGCLLTGMGRDGATGLLEIRRAGGRTIAQDEASSVIWGMPREAIALGAAEAILPLDQIGPAIAKLVTP